MEISSIIEPNCTKSNCSGNGYCNKIEKQCICNLGFFSSDCSLQESEFKTYSNLKKILYNKLQE